MLTPLQVSLKRLFALENSDASRDLQIENLYVSTAAAKSLVERLQRYSELGKGLARSRARELLREVEPLTLPIEQR